MSRLHFHGRGLFQWDTWYHVAPDGLVHAFYLQQLRPGSDRSQVEADSIGHAVSRDLISWSEQPPAVPPNPPGTEGDLVNWTGSTVERDGTFYLFYTIRSSASGGREQSIGLATSPDLWTWTKHPGNPVLTPDPHWYATVDHPAPHGLVDCRDLMVVKHPERSGWFGVYATRLADPPELSDAAEPADVELPETAVFAGAYSEDLVHWEQTPPVYASPQNAYSIVEMPDLFALDGRWYLTWLEDTGYGNRGVLGDPALTSGTVYAVADRIEGPYVEPPDNVIMASTGFNGISCRTVVLGGRTYVAYTSCQRENENEIKPTFGVLSWPKEVRLVEGRLRFCFAELVLTRVGAELITATTAAPVAEVHSTHETHGRWRQTTGADASVGWTGSVRTAWARVSFEPVAADLIATVAVTVTDAVAAGLLIRQQGSRGAVALLDVDQQRVMFCTVPRFQAIDARPWPLERGREYLLRVLATEEFIEVYLDEVLVLQHVWYGPTRDDSTAGRVGLLVDRGTAEFTGLTVSTLV